MEITLKHHKGANKKPKLYVLNLISRAKLTDTKTIYLFCKEEFPILCLITHILTIALQNNTIKVEDCLESAEPFFTTNLKDPTKANRVF